MAFAGSDESLELHEQSKQNVCEQKTEFYLAKPKKCVCHISIIKRNKINYACRQ